MFAPVLTPYSLPWNVLKNVFKILKLIAVLAFFLSVSFVNCEFYKVFEDSEDGVRKVYLYKNIAKLGDSGALCTASYNNTFLKTGWDVIQVQTNPVGYTDEEQASCAGEAEGALTGDAIYNYYHNNIRTYCRGRKKVCKKMAAFLKEHLDWVEETVKKNASDSAIWYHVNLFYKQVKGLHLGYTEALEDASKALSLHDFIMMNLQTDTDDVIAAITGDVSAKVRGKGHCSAIVKLLSGHKDLLVSHTTWTDYVQMNRMLKRYDIPFKTNATSDTVVPGRNISFAGAPAVITSGDDFYVTSAGLIVLETTIGNSNASLWSSVKSTGQLFDTVRSMVALRLADSGASWCEIFSLYNSGTYNNQWMIVDYNKFTQGSAPKKGTLYVLEQIPSYIRYEDQTSVLKKQLYWPSYNIPYYRDVFVMSGNQELVDEYGDWFTYDKTARALIFKRDQSSVTDVDSLMTLIRSNNYKNDEYSKCNCTPPYSAENAIAARCDLNPRNGTYPFDALGHFCFGAIDAKVVSPLYAQNLTFLAVSGPTTGTDLEPFAWSTSGCKGPHLGQPDSFDNFTTIVSPWLDSLF